MEANVEWLKGHMENTKLDPMMSRDDLGKFASSSADAGIEYVCVPLTMVEYAAEVLRGRKSKTTIAAVIGFPHGNEATADDKARQIDYAKKSGARHADVVLNLSMLRSDVEEFKEELALVSKKAHANGMLVKAIFETYYLSNAEIIDVARMCEQANFDYVKTSTGYAIKGKNNVERNAEKIGAAADAIELMGRGVVDKEKVGIKAAGGIRTYQDVIEVLSACQRSGWSMEKIRIGSSAGNAILKEAETVQRS